MNSELGQAEGTYIPAGVLLQKRLAVCGAHVTLTDPESDEASAEQETWFQHGRLVMGTQRQAHAGHTQRGHGIYRD